MTASNPKRCRMVFASRLPAPYREPLLELVSRQKDLELHVLYEMAGRKGTAWEAGSTGLESQFNYRKDIHRAMPAQGLHRLWSWLRTMLWCWRRLNDIKPDIVVLHGYSFPLAWSAWAWTRINRRPYALRSDSNGRLRRPSGLRGIIKRIIVGSLTRNAFGLLCIGTTNREYWRSFAARPTQEYDARYAIDQNLFRFTGNATRDAFRLENGFKDRFAILFVGRLITRKNLPMLLSAFKAASAQRNDLSLVIAGDGGGRDALESWKRANPDLHVRDLGAVRYDQMPALYSACDVLACPYEQEPWGLTINEALSCHLPVIACASGTVGAAVDLVQDGLTGITLEPLSDKSMSAAILRVAAAPSDVAAMRENAAELMQDWTFERAAEGFTSLARRAVNQTGSAA